MESDTTSYIVAPIDENNYLGDDETIPENKEKSLSNSSIEIQGKIKEFAIRSKWKYLFVESDDENRNICESLYVEDTCDDTEDKTFVPSTPKEHWVIISEHITLKQVIKHFSE